MIADVGCESVDVAAVFKKEVLRWLNIATFLFNENKGLTLIFHKQKINHYMQEINGVEYYTMRGPLENELCMKIV